MRTVKTTKEQQPKKADPKIAKLFASTIKQQRTTQLQAMLGVLSNRVVLQDVRQGLHALVVLL